MAPEVTIAVLLAVLAGLVIAGIRRVPEGSVYTLHRFGRFVRPLPPGLHFTLPWLDQIGHVVNLVGHRVALPTPADLSRAEVYFQILDPRQAGSALDDVDGMVLRLAGDRLLLLSAETTTTEPQALAQRLKSELNQHVRSLGLHVTRCQLA